MSDTTGWRRGDQGCYWKIIDGERYIVFPMRGGWSLRHRISRESIHQYLDAAKRAAHDHARSKA